MHIRQGRQVPGHVFGELARLGFDRCVTVALCPVYLVDIGIVYKLDERSVWWAV